MLDLSGKVGTIAVSAPTIVTLNFKINGKAAHAGFEPEKGISAILAFSNFVSKLKLGRIDYETTFNIGTINGGSGKNIVPDLVVFEGEIRGMNDKKIDSLLKDIENILDKETKALGATYSFSYKKDIKAYRINKDHYLVSKYQKALEELNYGKANIIDTFGGSDNNNFNLNGIDGVVISNAMNDVHTTHEYFEIEEFVKSTKILLKLVTM